MVIHNFQPKWFPWQPKSCGMLTISLLTGVLKMVKIGHKLMKLLQNVALLTNLTGNSTYFTLTHCEIEIISKKLICVRIGTMHALVT